MQLPFGHKAAESGVLPVEDVKRLRAQGKADRDIIVELKKQGHSFESIEKAMLQVLRAGGNPSPQGNFNQQGNFGQQGGFGPQGQMGGQGQFQNQPLNPRPQFSPQQGVLGAAQVGGMRPQQGFSGGPMQQGGPNLLTRETLNPQANMNIQVGGVVPLEAEAGNPTDIIEEVVEGVVEEKFEKIDEKFEAVTKDAAKNKEELENLKNLMLSSLQKRDKALDELKQSQTAMKDEIEDIVIKCSALEKAFKQFLPELTEKVRTQNTERRVLETTEA
jgi:hypothetical protein